MSPVNRYFNHVYVVNLARRPDRKAVMAQKLGRLGISAEFANAADGYTPGNLRQYEY